MNDFAVGAVAVFVYNSQNKFLVGVRENTSTGNGELCIPGGKIDFGETMEATAKREIREECGLELKQLKFITAKDQIFKKQKEHYIVAYYEAKVMGGKLHTNDKIRNWRWVNAYPPFPKFFGRTNEVLDEIYFWERCKLA